MLKENDRNIAPFIRSLQALLIRNKYSQINEKLTKLFYQIFKLVLEPLLPKESEYESEMKE